MSKLLSSGQARIAVQICALGAVAALMSGCSSDSTRFGDAFGNPFATGSIEKPKHVAARKPPATTGVGHSAPVVASALPPRTPPAVATPAPVAVSHETTGSIAPVHAGSGGWSGEGGASVTVAQGEGAALLAQRYGVPETVLLQVNGLHSAAELQPGARIVVPIYHAVATAAPARVAAAPVRAEPEAEPRAPERVAAAPREVEPVAPRAAPAEKAVETERVATERKAVVATKVAATKAAEAEREATRAKLAKAEAVAARKVPVKGAPAEAEKKAETTKMAAAAKAEAADRAAAAEAAKTAARTAAKAQAEAAKTAAVSAKPLAPAKATKLASVAPAASPAASKVETAPEVKKPVDTMPTASVEPAPAAASADPASPEFRWPVHGRIIQGFAGNDGINIAVPDGTPVKAAEGGVVAYAGSELKGYGNLVLIKHPNGYVTAYANNGELDVKRGEQVKRGQVIAKSGQSGNVASPQLHFELRKGSQPVDPTKFLAGL